MSPHVGTHITPHGFRRIGNRWDTGHEHVSKLSWFDASRGLAWKGAAADRLTFFKAQPYPTLPHLMYLMA